MLHEGGREGDKGKETKCNRKEEDYTLGRVCGQLHMRTAAVEERRIRSFIGGECCRGGCHLPTEEEKEEDLYLR